MATATKKAPSAAKNPSTKAPLAIKAAMVAAVQAAFTEQLPPKKIIQLVKEQYGVEVKSHDVFNARYTAQKQAARESQLKRPLVVPQESPEVADKTAPAVSAPTADPATLCFDDIYAVKGIVGRYGRDISKQLVDLVS